VRAYAAEALGTFALVVAGCGAIAVDARSGQLGHAGVALAFGLVVAVMSPTLSRPVAGPNGAQRRLMPPSATTTWPVM